MDIDGFRIRIGINGWRRSQESGLVFESQYGGIADVINGCWSYRLISVGVEPSIGCGVMEESC